MANKVRTVELHTNEAEQMRQRGSALAMEGRYREALEWLQQAQRLNPLSADIHLDKAVALRFLDRYKEAAETCRVALTILQMPAHTAMLLHQLRGDSLSLLGRPAEAVESYQRSLELRPELAYALHPLTRKAALLHSLGRRNEALAACNAAL